VSSWREFANDQAAFAERVRALFEAHKHHTMATLRRDGSPRISGNEVTFDEGELVLGIMAGARRADDLRRYPRLALHSHTVDPPDDDPRSWCGDAKIAGIAVEVSAERFRVDITEVVLTKVGSPADHLVIESWHPGRGLERRERR
jgi:hypothetical protein